MSSFSDQADMATMNRIISQETEPEISRFSYMAAAPHVAPDAVYFDHVGAQFPSRKGSHPHCVDVSEDEATEVQPSVTTPRAYQYYQLQHSPERGLQQRSPFTPEHTPPQGGSYVSLQGMCEIRRQRSKKYGRNDWCFDTQFPGTQKSTPTRTREPSPNTASEYSEQIQTTATDTHYPRTPHASICFSESHTPSHCSGVTDENDTLTGGESDTLTGGVGPFPPHPYSQWDPYNNQHNAGYYEEAMGTWKEEER